MALNEARLLETRDWRRKTAMMLSRVETRGGKREARVRREGDGMGGGQNGYEWNGCLAWRRGTVWATGFGGRALGRRCWTPGLLGEALAGAGQGMAWASRDPARGGAVDASAHSAHTRALWSRCCPTLRLAVGADWIPGHLALRCLGCI